MFIPLSFFGFCGVIFVFSCFFCRDKKYDGHPDSWPKEWFD